ncbi:MAG: hypothetical protein R3F19_12635 [Verrucomicrobiales bacterium]
MIDKHGKERIPRGWKRFQGQCYCDKCWKKNYCQRSLVLAITKPLDISWEELKPLLESAWKQTTQLSNSIITKLALLEPIRTPEMTKMPKAPSPYLYPWAREQFPDLDLQSANSLIQTVQRTYNRHRLEVFWRHSRSLPQYRYPVPAPFPSTSTKLEWLSDTDKVPIVTVRLGGKRIRLQLTAKHQKNFKNAIEQIINGEAKLCEGSIYRKVSHGSHRSSVVTRAPGGGQRVQSQVFIKLTAWFPITSSSGPAKRRHLHIQTGDEFFLTASLSGTQKWRLHAEHVRRWIATYTQRLGRLSDDQEYERRQTARQRLPINEYRAKLTAKHHRRIATFLKQTCAEVLVYAQRNGCKKILWEREKSGFFHSFPWYEFESMVEQRSQELGIDFERSSQEVLPAEV